MHPIHHTEAIIIRSEPANEANKRIWLLTREFGLLIVMVQGVRKSTAKLQSQLTDYSVINADLIKGKSTWRLISARVKEVVLRPKARSALGRSYVRTLGLLERFLTGEGTHPELFDHIIACGLIAQAEQGDARAFDALSLWKVLVLLGYVAVPAEDEILFTLPLDQALAEMDDRRIKKLIQHATDAIHYSHL